MIDAANLSELLTRNVHPQLYPRIFIMAPSGSLIAYSTPADMAQIRDQAALISMAWREYPAVNGTPATDAQVYAKTNGLTEGKRTGGDAGADEIRALTVECGSYNIIARVMQQNLILVLVGGVFVGMRSSFKVTAETAQDPVYPSGEVDGENSDEHVSTLQLQRRKADKLAEFIESSASLLNGTDGTLPGKPFS